MTSDKQAAANRHNAAKSTGPKTAKGKQIARMNALKHGFQAENVVIPGEDPKEFEALFRSLEEHYQPVGSVEGLLVERIAHYTWWLQRISLIETAIMRSEHFRLERERAKDEVERARDEMNRIASAFDCDPDEYDPGDGDSDDADEHNLPEDKAEALNRSYDKAEEAYEKTKEAYDKSEDELKNSFCSIEVVFRRSTKRLEMLSRYCATTRANYPVSLPALWTASKPASPNSGYLSPPVGDPSHQRQ